MGELYSAHLSGIFSKDVLVPVAASLFGALFGSIGSFLIQRSAHRAALRLQQDARKEENLAYAQVCLFKLGDIYSEIQGMKKQFDSFRASLSVEKADPFGKWPKYQRLIGYEARLPAIEVREPVFLIDAGRPEMISEVILCQRQYSNIINIVEKFMNERERLSAALEQYRTKIAPGRMVQLEVPMEVFHRLQADMLGLDNLIDQIHEMLDAYSISIFNTAEEFGNMGKSYFGASRFPTLTQVET